MERLLRELGIAQVGPGAGANMHVIVDSAVVGVEKPHPAIFTSALEALDQEAGSVAYVGDTLAFDVAGATAAGLLPIHLDPFGLCPDPVGHEHVSHVGDIEGLITLQHA